MTSENAPAVFMAVLAGQFASNPRCPPVGQFYTGAWHAPPGVATLNLGAGPTKPVANNSRVPVMHHHLVQPQWDDIETTSPWFYIVKGSAVWIDVGHTIAFDTHADAVRYFLREPANDFPEINKQIVRLVPVAKRLGIDSIQFLKHCDNRCGCIGTELVRTTPSTDLTCPATFYDAIDSQTPCTCISSMSWANCNGKITTAMNSGDAITLFDLILSTALLAGAVYIIGSIYPCLATCALGLFLWLPANALADEMATMIYTNAAGRSIAAVSNIAIQAGSLGLFAVPWLDHWALLIFAITSGMFALAICAAAPDGLVSVTVASVLAGYCGSVGSTVVWPVLFKKRAVKAFSVGLSLACYLSGAAIMAQRGGADPRFSASVYFSGALALFVATAALSVPRHAIYSGGSR